MAKRRSFWKWLKGWIRWRGWLLARVPAAPRVDRPSAELVRTGVRGGLFEPETETWKLIPHDGYRELLATVPDLTAVDLIRANQMAQVIAGHLIEDPQLAEHYRRRLRWTWFWRRIGLFKARPAFCPCKIGDDCHHRTGVV